MIKTIRVGDQNILLDENDYEIAKNYKWSFRNKTVKIPVTYFNGKPKSICIVVFGDSQNNLVHHKNHNYLDFTRQNIIVCDQSLYNYLKCKCGATGYYGVLKDKNTFCVGVRQKTGIILHETYHSIIDAALAADYHAVNYYGELAKKNLPELSVNDLVVRYNEIRAKCKQYHLEDSSRKRQGKPTLKIGEKSSQYVGVTWKKSDKKWCSIICNKGKEVFSGLYSDEKEAAIAYDYKALEYYGSNATRNFPEIPAIEIDKLFEEIEEKRNCLAPYEKSSKTKQGIKSREQNKGTSIYVGVSKNGNKWMAQITHMRNYYIGNFDDEVQAAIAYDEKALELFGEDAKLNFPERRCVMNKYNIIKLHNEPYAYLVIATTYESPIDYIDVIKNEIEYPEARILFDLLLINGDKNNRFIGLYYKVNEEFTPSAYFVADDVTDEIKEVSAQFFFENKMLVEKSVLPNALKYMITNSNK